MSEATLSSFVDELLRAPAGVAPLARLEITQRNDIPWFGWPSDCDPGSVQRAASSVSAMPYGELLELAVSSAERLAGPWSGEALMALPYLYEHAVHRRPIAEALSDKFRTELCPDADFGAQQWWHDEPRDRKELATTCFTNYSNVYGNGEFTCSGLWTATDPPPQVHDALIVAWDFYGRPTTRWLLPVRSNARVWNINGPEDWAHLVETYPKVANGSHAGWELPGPNQHPSDLKKFKNVISQHAVRTERVVHVLPDWVGVAADFDGVHLSWAGFLTTEGYISDLSNVGTTMMRYWGSERTLWLHDVFDEPKPLDAPTLTGRVGGGVGVDASSDAERQVSDRLELEGLLGREGVKRES
jgi:hypothetical protein